MSARAISGVFCLEGQWSPKLTDRESMKPVLDILEARRTLKYVHRDVATEDELCFYLKKWRQRQYRSFGIGHFAFHGTGGRIVLGRRELTLEELAVTMEGHCDGRVIFFDSCSTLNVTPKRLAAFRKQTGARVVCGYTKRVDWVEPAGFELMLLEKLAEYKHADAPFRWLQRNHAQFVKRLGFRWA